MLFRSPEAAAKPAPAEAAPNTAKTEPPQVTVSRDVVAETMAQHLRNAGISPDEIESFRENKPAWDLFWNNTANVTEASKQAHYNPSPATVEATLDKLRGPAPADAEPAFSNGPVVVPEALRGNPRAMEIAQQLAHEMMKPGETEPVAPPEGIWPLLKTGDVVQLQGGKTVKVKAVKENGEILY